MFTHMQQQARDPPPQATRRPSDSTASQHPGSHRPTKVSALVPGLRARPQWLAWRLVRGRGHMNAAIDVPDRVSIRAPMLPGSVRPGGRLPAGVSVRLLAADEEGVLRGRPGREPGSGTWRIARFPPLLASEPDN